MNKTPPQIGEIWEIPANEPDGDERYAGAKYFVLNIEDDYLNVLIKLESGIVIRDHWDLLTCQYDTKVRDY